MGKALEALTLVELLENPNKAVLVRDRFGSIFTDEDSPETIVAKFLVANDVVQVVRCKDCKRGNIATVHLQEVVRCPYLERCMELDGFCSYGERRQDNA